MLEQIARHFEINAGRPAIFIESRFFSYAELSEKVAAIQAEIEAREPCANTIIGVVLHSDFETYASLLAILFSGNGYLPINPTSPSDRNINVLHQAGARLLLSSDRAGFDRLSTALPLLGLVSTRQVSPVGSKPIFRAVPQSHYAYLLFTSGSTGIPKGVPISRGNLDAFLTGFFDAGISMNENDRVLQMFELTFDFSVMSCFAPWVVGACLYPAAANELKFMSVYRLLEEQEITVAPMVPSALAFLRPFFGASNIEITARLRC